VNGRDVAVTEEDPLGALLALENGADAAAAAPAYARALRRLADALTGPNGGSVGTQVAEWLLDALQLAPPTEEWATWREARWDAAVDMAADPVELAGFFRRTADQVDRTTPRRLHLLSLMRARVVWRARDKMRRHQLRQDRHTEATASMLPTTDPQARCVARLVVARVAEEVDNPPLVQQALAALLAGESVSEAAQSTGLSRQAIYRALARIRQWVEAGS